MQLISLQDAESVAKSSVNRARYCIVAAHTVQVYDWLLLLGEEVELIYPTRWSTTKISYFICRFYPLVVFPLLIWVWLGDFEQSFCERIVHPIYTMVVPLQLASQAVVLIRSYAFTGRKLYVLAILAAAFVALAVAELWLFGTQFPISETLFLLLPRTGCFGNDALAEYPPHLGNGRALQSGIIFLCVFLLDLLAMILVIVHCLRMSSTQGRLGKQFLCQAIGVFAVMAVLNLGTASIYLGYLRLSLLWIGSFIWQ